jgi:hypothetical protein
MIDYEKEMKDLVNSHVIFYSVNDALARTDECELDIEWLSSAQD